MLLAERHAWSAQQIFLGRLATNVSLSLQRCWQNVSISFVHDFWLDLLLYIYIAGNILAFLAIPFFNRSKLV